MCANCKDSGYCDCAGGASLAICSCQEGYACVVCGHEAEANVSIEPGLLTDLPSPEIIVEFDSEDGLDSAS